MLFTVLLVALVIIAFLLVTAFGITEVVTLIHCPEFKNRKSFLSFGVWYLESLLILSIAFIYSHHILREHDWFYGFGNLVETFLLVTAAVWISLRMCKHIERRITGWNSTITGPYVDDLGAGA